MVHRSLESLDFLWKLFHLPDKSAKMLALEVSITAPIDKISFENVLFSLLLDPQRNILNLLLYLCAG